MVSASKTVNGTTFVSEVAKTEPVLLPEANPAKLTYTVNGKSLTAAAKTSDDSRDAAQTQVDDAFTGQTNTSEIQLSITADQDISYLLDVDGEYLTDASGAILDHSLNAGETRVHTFTLADGGSNIGICAINGQGDYTQNTVTVEVDTTPPELMLDNVVVQSRDNRYTITGTAENNSAVTINGQTVPVTNGRFEYSGTGVVMPFL